MIAIALAAALCPPDAVAASAMLGVYTVPTVPIVGQPAQVVVRLVWPVFFPGIGPAASYGCGSVQVTVGGTTYTLTNTIPQIGHSNCAPAQYYDVPMPYVFTQNTLVYAQYTGLAGTLPVTASNVKVVSVRTESPIFISRRPFQLWWYGYGEYQLQGSEDARSWIDLAVLSGNDGFYYYSEPNDKPQRYYRYRKQ